jgi:hypothetical protein
MADNIRAQVHLRIELALDLFRTEHARGRKCDLPQADMLELGLVDFWMDQSIQWATARYGQKN